MTDYTFKQLMEVLRGIDASLALIAGELGRIADASTSEVEVKEIYRRPPGSDA